MTTPSSIVTDDVVDGLEGRRKVRLTLPLHMECIEQRETVAGWAATFAYFEQRCVLRTRPKGTIECEGTFLLARSGRERTGTKRKKEAIEWVYDRMRRAHLRHVEKGSSTGGSPLGPDVTPTTFRLSHGAHILRRRHLIPGKLGSKSQAGYELVLDIALAVWNEDPVLASLGNSHIARMYNARSGSERFSWPPGFEHRRSLAPVAPQTVQGDLVDLKTLFGKLIGESDDAGNRFLQANPLEGLELGTYSHRVLPEAEESRYSWVISVADEAVESIRTRGHQYRERRTYRGELREYSRTQRFPRIVPGILRHMLVLVGGHAQRPQAWRHLKVVDTARTFDETHALISSLRLARHDAPIQPEWAEVWSHGAYAYRKDYSKGKRGRKYERAVPLSADMAAEHDLYMERRTEWLKNAGTVSPWLFPSPRDPRKPISEEDARMLLEHADDLARTAAASAGLNPNHVVRRLESTAWYAYRRRWKTTRNALGWEGNRNAAYVAGWTTRKGDIADTVYARFGPHLILAVVEGLTIVEAVQSDESVTRAKAAARVRPPETLPNPAGRIPHALQS